MSTSLQGDLERWEHWKKAGVILERVDQPTERAAALAQLLREVAPRAALAVCSLEGIEGSALAVEANGTSTSTANSWRETLAALASADEDGAGVALPAPFSDLVGVSATVGHRGMRWGTLLLGLPRRTPVVTRMLSFNAPG